MRPQGTKKAVTDKAGKIDGANTIDRAGLADIPNGVDQAEAREALLSQPAEATSDTNNLHGGTLGAIGAVGDTHGSGDTGYIGGKRNHDHRHVQGEIGGKGQGKLLWTMEQVLLIQGTEVRSALDQTSQLVAEALGADKVDCFLYDPAIKTLIALGTSNTPMGRREREIGMGLLVAYPVALIQYSSPLLSNQAELHCFDPLHQVGLVTAEHHFIASLVAQQVLHQV